MFDLTNKTAVITGAASGIGKAVALLFAKQGATVHILDLNKDHAASVANGINAAKGNAFAHACNVANHDEVLQAFNAIGKTDILVTCAGIAHIANVENTSEADLDRLYSVNIKGTYNCLFAAIPGMKENGSGAIVNMCSIAAHVGISDRFAYSMTKGAVHAMTLSIARDYISNGIRCNSVSPARVHTPFVDDFLVKNYPGKEEEMFGKLSKTQPIGRMAQPAEVAHLILYLCSDEAAFITGCDYPVDGGFIKLNN